MKWRFIGALMGVTLIVLLVQVIPLGFYLQQVEHTRITTALERDAFLIAQRSEEALETQSTQDDFVITEQATKYSQNSGARVVVVNDKGIVVGVSDDDESDVGTSYLSRPEIEQALAGSVSTGHRFSQSLGQELLYVAVPVFSGEKTLGAVRLTYPDYIVTENVDRQLWVLTLITLGSILVAGAVGYIVSGTITRRITLLQRVTEKFASGDLNARAEVVKGPSELVQLGRSFNAMAEKIDALIQQQQRFAADASHQLRTPLTALRLRLERAQSLLENNREAADRIQAAETEAIRLGNIIEGLLLLSRTESSLQPKKILSISEIILTTIERWAPLAEEQGIFISYVGPEKAKVKAVPQAVEQVLDNYIDNALRATKAGGSIEVSLNVGETYTVLDVSDRGKGLSQEECDRAFDRFWRGTSDKEGSGLGLAIVAELMKASGGSAELFPREGGGVVARARFLNA